ETAKESYDTLRSLANAEPKWFVGLCADFEGSNEFDYYISVATTNEVPEGFTQYKVPAATWAILEKDGDLMNLADRFWTQWLPSSGYKRAGENIPDIEVYPDVDMPKENYNYELWYPVVKV
ncbi:MAG: effector binding domain-containing protein, partial [Oscillospiraceae bacterium]|nr:effector binding domain-containing protein [Oscillospiraceae bacterium]